MQKLIVTVNDEEREILSTLTVEQATFFQVALGIRFIVEDGKVTALEL